MSFYQEAGGWEPQKVQQPHISANKGTENKQQAHSAWYVYQQPNKKLSVVGCQMYPDDSYLGIF